MGAPATVFHGKRVVDIQRVNHVIGRNAHITKKPDFSFEITDHSHAFDYNQIKQSKTIISHFALVAVTLPHTQAMLHEYIEIHPLP